ncbi:LytR/AlgR family response regulator transcription factor [Mucilaginibacter myungsuensis]|uniref:Response regulator transcription factor n=1 Tax=Mucilaginibacter myungsuensis TaxID=649104 RepID=A0A929PWY5_9SPHI|nr:LytTR family DNA-binding domain-containing protein [Mucilaginibacter myungsuensis]MBE9663318.1 response regulator transcription factor [Mucilaginibacter myungsuensis]MDN3600053.1 LytTR family DNA-binding domain-containing protein [Mucilaginibacter myungsuensis]
MRSIIIDDEISNQENLQQLLQTYAPDVQVCALADDVDSGLKAIRQHGPDLLFLDIQLHARSGFDLLKELADADMEVIFVTAYDQYGIQAVKFAALDYLLKPIDIDELKAAVAKAREAIQKKRKNDRLEYLLDYLRDDNKNQPRIALPLFGETRYVNIADIMRCEADNTYTRFVLQSGEQVIVSKTLKEYADMLGRHNFLRPHQSHLVNAAFIKSWLKEDGGSLLLTDGTKIPVSKLNRDKMREALAGVFKL